VNNSIEGEGGKRKEKSKEGEEEKTNNLTGG